MITFAQPCFTGTLKVTDGFNKAIVAHIEKTQSDNDFAPPEAKNMAVLLKTGLDDLKQLVATRVHDECTVVLDASRRGTDKFKIAVIGADNRAYKQDESEADIFTRRFAKLNGTHGMSLISSIGIMCLNMILGNTHPNPYKPDQLKDTATTCQALSVYM